MRIRTRTMLILLSLLVCVAPFMAKPALANGEIYTWKTYDTIEITGGSTINVPGAPNHLTGNVGVLPGQAYLMTGLVVVHSKQRAQGCLIELSLAVFGTNPGSPNNGSGRVGYSFVNGPVASQVPLPPNCTDADLSPDVKDGFNNAVVTIQGIRPGQNDTPETDDQRDIVVVADYAGINPPNNIPITISGNNQDETATSDGAVPKKGAPQTSEYIHHFKRDPGHYKICAGNPVNDCKEIDKKRYEPIPVELGKDSVVGSIKTTVHISFFNYPDTTIGPFDITLRDLNGKNLGNIATTDSINSGPDKDTFGAVEHRLQVTATTLNVDPGDYKVCVEGVKDACATVHKDADKQAEASITLNIDQVTEVLNSIANKKDPNVCDTGGGLGGVFGFVLCPLMRVMVDATDIIQKTFIIPYLTVSPLDTVDHATGKPSVAYTLWKSFRDLANVVLVIAFFAVIFSQATSIGVSNYGIKKILPRLALVAIGANLSYFIVAFIVDAFNIFGAGVSSLVLGVVNAGANSGTTTTGVGVGQEAFWIIATPALIAVALKTGVFLKALGFIVIPIFLTILVSVVVLVIRQMLILLLVIVSPLAIVAYLLPNTEQYYKKWNKLLLELLIMYPMIVILFAVGKILGTILASGVNLTG